MIGPQLRRRHICCRPTLAHLVLLFSTLFTCSGQVPQWIWSNNYGAPAAPGEIRFFRKSFNVPFEVREATLTAAGDDEITLYLNGRQILQSRDWKKPVTVDAARDLKLGANVIATRGKNGAGGPAAILVRLEIRSPNMSPLFIVSDTSWLSSTEAGDAWQTSHFDPAKWTHAVSLGPLGAAPWGDILQAPQATSAESLVLLPGFKAELLHSAAPGEGSWIAMCLDDRGRLIVSPERDEAPLLRFTLAPSGSVAKIETIPARVRAAMGLLYAHHSLYVNGHGPRGVGLYRLIDRNGNDQFDPGEEQLLKNFDGDNEHGYHAVVLGPDSDIYVMNGNHTKVPPGIVTNSPHQNFAEDLLLPRLWDANGHAKGILAPGGYILRTDPQGTRWELMCGGFRNTYDFDFSPEGEIFTFDSDMEWDIGCPWYRPTRILHCVKGGEYGWRSGTGKWPAYYPDSLPSVVDVGLSSPTAVKFGTKSNFPEKYRRALFAADWAYGKIFAVHLSSSGASYTGKFETFVSGKPLAVTALTFGADGAMYFIIGGWKIQSGLYRIGYQPTAAAVPLAHAPPIGFDSTAEHARRIRRQLESFYARPADGAVDDLWPYLGSGDRSLRYAARLALEFQNPSQWHQRALQETNTDTSLGALLALVRTAGADRQADLLARLDRLSQQPLDERQALEALRVLQLCFIRMGTPDPATATACAEKLSRFYPAPSEFLNRELSQLLAFLEAPQFISKTLALMAAAPMQQEQMHYAFVLRTVKRGWTLEQRRTYFSWFKKALREYQGGASFKPYLVNIRNEAAANLAPSERDALASILEDRAPCAADAAPQRPFVREWTLADLDPLLGQADRQRSPQKGRMAFSAAHCIQCHRAGGDGGAVGPDLTGVSGRFSRRDLLENILWPSKVISDRYQTWVVTTKDGDDFTGFITEESSDKLVLITNPLAGERQEIPKTNIQSRSVSKISAMPEGLLNVLTREEILDLLAFLESTKPGAALTSGAR